MDVKVKELLNKYLEITKVISSAAAAKNIDIFEEKLLQRKTILDQILLIDKDQIDKVEFNQILGQIEVLEEGIKVNSEIMKNETEKKQTEHKFRISKIEKLNSISNKYKYGGVNQSSYFDQKK